MSGLAGVRWLDDRVASIDDLVAPLTALVHRGPDGLFAAVDGPCASGLAQQVTTPEAQSECQPLTTPHGLVIAFDGRLDNATELRHALGVSRSAATADVEVVAAAWQRWGEATLDRLLGDFAMSIWDRPARRLWLARDVFGVRPLLYRRYGGGFWWASELQALARLGDARANEGVIAEYLSDRITSESETLVSGVLRVPRGAIVRLDESGATTVRRYWEPRVGRPHHRSAGEAVEQFDALIQDAVRVRLRSNRPVALMLSGGLDSGLIAVSVGRLGSRPSLSPVEAFSSAWPGNPADESARAREVAGQHGLRSTIVNVGRLAQWHECEAEARATLDLPQPATAFRTGPLRDAIRHSGLRAVLWGFGGDEWFSGHSFAMADNFAAGDLRSLWRNLSERRAEGFAAALGHLKIALWLQLSEGTKQRTRRWLGIKRTPAWIGQELAEHTALADRLRAGPTLDWLPTHAQRQMFSGATSADAMFFAEYAERIEARSGLEPRLPFYDRRLVEWALALPEEHRRAGGERKAVLRRAAAGRLPPSVLNQRRVDFSFVTAQALHALGGRPLVERIARERAGWVDAARISRLFTEMVGIEERNGARLGHSSWVLWLLVATHLAVRAIETATTAKNQRPAPVRDVTLRAHCAAGMENR